MLLGIGATIVITTRGTLVPANSVAELDALPRSTELLEAGTRQAIGGPAWLDVRVAGSALWTRAGLVSTFPATAHSPPSSWEGAHATASYAAGAARVSTDVSVWTWVRVQPTDPSGPTALVRVPPFVGTQEVHVVLPDTAALHVLVLHADGLTPASTIEVLVEQRMPTNRFSVIARGTTDAAGYARLVDLSDGEAVVRTANSALNDREPLSVRRVLHGKSVLADQIVTLVLPPSRRTLALDVELTALPADLGLPPRLFLREMGSGQVTPVRAALQLGQNRVEVEVEPGDYLVDCLPLGSFQTNLAGGMVRVSTPWANPGTTLVALTENRARTRLVLDGLRPTDFPARVVLRNPDLPIHADERALFYGQLSWHGPAAEVPSVFTPVQLVVATKQGWLISRQALPVAGAEVRVDLVPACRASITWKTQARPARPLIAARTAGPGVFVPFRLAAAGPPAPPAVFFQAELIVPQGAATFTCTDEAGRALWQRDANLTTAAVEVVL